MKQQEYIEKWLAGTLTREEEALFRETAEYANLQRIDNALKRFQPSEPDWNSSFEKIKATRQKEAKVVSFNWSTVIRIAAVLVLGLGIGFFFFNRSTEKSETAFSTGAGETLEVTLPDNSLVRLNAKSSVSFSAANWAEQRRVTLKGEAFFQVEKGEKFDVVTNSGTVSVLGTQFTVKDRTNFYEVVCYEGKVKVAGSGNGAQLTAKQAYREVLKHPVDVQIPVAGDAPSWLNHESAFESVPFREVLDELSRQYDLSITTNNVDLNELFTGRFPNSDVETALKSVTMPFGLTYKIKGKEISIVHAD